MLLPAAKSQMRPETESWREIPGRRPAETEGFFRRAAGRPGSNVLAMSDSDGGSAAKRPKTNDDAGPRPARNGELTAAETRDPRGGGSHELVVAENSTVDLSRFNPFLVTQVASFLGLSRELLSMALVCKAFGWRQQQPSSTPGLSLVEEAARQFLANQLRPSEIERSALSERENDGTTPWLSNLHELERLRVPLKFSKLIGSGIEYSGTGRDMSVVKADPRGYDSTAMTNYVIRRGVHYATFRLISGKAHVGVVRPLPDFDFVHEGRGFGLLDERNFGDLLAQRTEKWVGDVHCCDFSDRGAESSDWRAHRIRNIVLCWGNGRPVRGDRVGLLVDMNEGTLSVCKNGRRLGVVKDGLAGEYCFYTSLRGRQIRGNYEYYLEPGDEVSIERETPPPVEDITSEVL